MGLSVSSRDGISIVAISDAVDRIAAGSLYDALVACIGDGSMKLIVDLSGVHTLTHAGARGLLVAAKLLRSARGHMRICGAESSIEAFLLSLGFDHLLKCDPTIAASMAALSRTASR